MSDRVVELNERNLIVGVALDYSQGWFDEADAGDARREDRGPDLRIVEVVEVHGEIATAIVRSDVYREHPRLVPTGEGCKIVNALWQPA